MDSEKNCLLGSSRYPYIIIGAGGHSKVIIDILKLRNIEIHGFFDDNITDLKGLAYLGKISEINELTKKDNYKFVIALGDCALRKKIADNLSLTNENYGIVIHPNAVLSTDTSIGVGTVIFANAVVNPGSLIGEHVIVNTGSIIEHDCIVESYVHLSPNVALAGGVHVGKGTHIGIGSQCIQMKKIGVWCIIGAGSTVVSDIPSYTLSYGTPAKIMKEGIYLEF
ncbi:acetyltransferase [Enterococcus mundtii]|uniref:acetyltransferase n=1 Tax=Enterococcus TaxID=1350 RepID=UPI000D362644|nr:acetyltransferase [Enterococcus mundtii]PTO37086.1 transferase [Enterococcus mundtii]PTO40735.1 transferase [Enterococcus mundtii]